MKNIELIELNQIQPNEYQPRLNFNQDSIKELAESIAENGLIQPIVVRKKGDGYQIIAGERRFRACLLLGHTSIAGIVLNSSDLESAQMALVENIQRSDLSAIEEAVAYLKLIKETGITQSELAQKMGRSQSSVANKLRLLNLPRDIQEKVSDKTITERHARALLKVDADKIDDVFDVIVKKGLNVAQSEKYIEGMNEEIAPKYKTQGYSKSIKIGMNTITQAVKMCEKAGIVCSVTVQENDDNVKMIVEFIKEGN